MKTFTDVFLVLMNLNLDLGMHFLFLSMYPNTLELTIELFQWPVGGVECGCECFCVIV